MSISVRPATIQDAAGIASVSVASWQHAYAHILPPGYLAGLSVSRRCERIAHTIGQGGKYWVAESSGAIIGFVSVGANEEESVPADAELKAIYLLPSHLGSGLGRTLLRTGVTHLLEEGFTSLCAFAFRDNEVAGKFYLGLGAEAFDQGVYTLEGVDYPDQSYVWRDLRNLLTRLSGQ